MKPTCECYAWRSFLLCAILLVYFFVFVSFQFHISLQWVLTTLFFCQWVPASTSIFTAVCLFTTSRSTHLCNFCYFIVNRGTCCYYAFVENMNPGALIFLEFHFTAKLFYYHIASHASIAVDCFFFTKRKHEVIPSSCHEKNCCSTSLCKLDCFLL